MTNVLMHDSRRLVFPLDTMVDALIEFDRAHKRWPERAKPESARLVPSGVVVSVTQSGQDAPIDRNYSLSIIAAAIIHYCAKMRVPVPKNASKSVTVTPDGITMILEGTLLLQRQHQALPPGSITRPPVTEAEPEQATESATEPAVEQATESTAEPVAEEATQSGAEPVMDQAAEFNAESVSERPTTAPSDSPPAEPPDAVPVALDTGAEGKEAEHSAVT